jgi:hypothetical protein
MPSRIRTTRERHEIHVHRQQHQFDGHQQDDRVLAVEEDAGNRDAEQHRGVLEQAGGPHDHAREIGLTAGGEAGRPRAEEVLGDGVHDDDGDGAQRAVQELHQDLVLAEHGVDERDRVGPAPAGDPGPEPVLVDAVGGHQHGGLVVLGGIAPEAAHEGHVVEADVDQAGGPEAQRQRGQEEPGEKGGLLCLPVAANQAHDGGVEGPHQDARHQEVEDRAHAKGPWYQDAGKPCRGTAVGPV